MRPRIRGWSWIVLLMAFSLIAAACGDADQTAGPGATETGATDTGGDDGEGQATGDIIIGTTETVSTIDPARCYDFGCSTLLRNTTNTLLGFPPGEAEPQPELAAEMPEISEDGLTYTFTLREGVTFHDGSEMTSEDVKFSLERARDIAHPEGAGFLLGGIESIETPEDLTVEITLSEPDVTFASKLAYAVAAILPSDGAYTAPDEPLDGPSADEADEFINEDELVATGPYQVTDFRESESVTYEAFDEYWGEAPANDRVLTRIFEGDSQLKGALEAGEVDVAFRHLTPQQREDLEGNEDIQVLKGEGAFIRYIVLNPNLEPFDDVNVRKAFAAAIDRQRIIDDVLLGAGEPLYSMVPSLFPSSIPAFQEEYEGQEPSDFIDEPVEFELYYPGARYGDTEPELAQTIQRMAEETDLFTVTPQLSEWAQFSEQAWPGETGQYPAFLLAWYPDYLDADDYLYPFYHSEKSFLGMYENEQVDSLIEQEQTASAPDAPEREEAFKEIQRITADEVPIIPLFEAPQYAYARSNVSGVETTLDAAQQFRFWVISKSE